MLDEIEAAIEDLEAKYGQTVGVYIYIYIMERDPRKLKGYFAHMSRGIFFNQIIDCSMELFIEKK